MKTITELKVQEKNKKRVSVFLDGEFYCGMGLFTVMQNRLKVGEQVDEKRLAEIAAEDNYSEALDKALNYIAKAMHTKMQVIVYLKKKEYDGKTIARVIDKLQEYGYIDDEMYAKKFAEERSRREGKRKIALELKVKGIDPKISETVLDDEFSEDEGCRRVAEKYLKGRPLDRELKQKCYRYLLSKGFDYDVAKSTLDKISRDDEDY